MLGAPRRPSVDLLRLKQSRSTLVAGELREHVARVRAAAHGEAMTPVLDAIEAIVAGGRPVPLTDQVRIPTEELDELRALVKR